MNDVTRVPDGALYDANNDERVLQLRERAKMLCYDYNLSRPGNNETGFDPIYPDVFALLRLR
ncbi:maltose acetyltransferase domain-containing protein [Erwinia amylovora]